MKVLEEKIQNYIYHQLLGYLGLKMFSSLHFIRDFLCLRHQVCLHARSNFPAQNLSRCRYLANISDLLFNSFFKSDFMRHSIGSPKIGVESFILMIEHILVSILINLMRAILLSLRNHINITIIVLVESKIKQGIFNKKIDFLTIFKKEISRKMIVSLLAI